VRVTEFNLQNVTKHRFAVVLTCRTSHDVATSVERQRLWWRHHCSSVTWQHRKAQPTVSATRK